MTTNLQSECPGCAPIASWKRKWLATAFCTFYEPYQVIICMRLTPAFSVLQNRPRQHRWVFFSFKSCPSSTVAKCITSTQPIGFCQRPLVSFTLSRSLPRFSGRYPRRPTAPDKNVAQRAAPALFRQLRCGAYNLPHLPRGR